MVETENGAPRPADSGVDAPRDGARADERADERAADTDLFVLTATHDLQEPLRKIVTFVDLLEDALAKGRSDDAAYAMRVVRRSARQAQRLVIDLLLHTRLGNRPLRLEPVDVTQVIRDVLSSVAGTVQETSAIVAIDLVPTVVAADRTQLYRLVLNLVSNALKYHKVGEEPYLAITLRPDADGGRLVVADRGIGFESTYREEIFRPFRRLNAETESRGSGIGLTTCRAIADRHGWIIEADGEVGRGATFTLRFRQATS